MNRAESANQQPEIELATNPPAECLRCLAAETMNRQLTIQFNAAMNVAKKYGASTIEITQETQRLLKEFQSCPTPAK